MAIPDQLALDFEMALVNNDLKYDRDDSSGQVHLQLNFGGGDFSYPHIAVHVLFDEDGRSVRIVTSPIVNVKPEKRSMMIELCNSFNTRFRWVKFYVDDENDLMCDTDALISEGSAGEECTELVMRTAGIVDDAYEQIMKAQWSD